VEGPSLHRLLRTQFHCPVELHTSRLDKRCECAVGNFDQHGMFLMAEQLPVGVAVHIKICAHHAAELDGLVRRSGRSGTAITFSKVTASQHHQIDDLIEEFTPGEILAS